MKMKSEWRALKIRSKNLLNMKVVNYLTFVFHIEVKTNSKYKILNFKFRFSIYQKYKMALWVHGLR